MQKKEVAKCHKCGGIIVTWNWFRPTEFIASDDAPYWSHECWICNDVISTPEEVTNGVPYEVCQILWGIHMKGGKVEYTEAMRLLYSKSKS